MEVIGENIKKRRKELRLTQEELAKKLGYKSRTTIAKIESGENELNHTKLAAFAEALETTPLNLMEWNFNAKRHLQQIRENRDTVIIQNLLGFMGCKIEMMLSEEEHKIIGYKVEHKENSFNITVEEFYKLINSIKSYIKFTIYELIEKQSEAMRNK